MSYLVTGAAGFIGFHLCMKLIKDGIPITGFDNFNSYYDPNLKRARIQELQKVSLEKNVDFKLITGDLSDKRILKQIFLKTRPSKVIHLAAQAGVRFSIENPSEYINSNILGFLNILEFSKEFSIEHLIYASSSSVYGGNQNLPFSEGDNVDHPVSIYAATKKSNELMAHSYSHLFDLPTTGLRFFTVYGPWGRPDMAFFIFTKQILNNEPIKIFNNGNMIRDFTYIDDVVESLIRVINKTPQKNNQFNFKNPNPSSSWSPFKVFNVGNSTPTKLMEYINALEKALGKKAKKQYMPMQPGDVEKTLANNDSLEQWISYKPSTSIEEGIAKFVKWYLDFYG